MSRVQKARDVSFAVTISLSNNGEEIYLITRTDPERVTTISADPEAADGHAQLYGLLRSVLTDKALKIFAQCQEQRPN